MNKKQLIGSVSALAIVGVAWIAWLAYGAHRNLVTLDVRDMDVREVVRKMERQTREFILVNKEVQGKLTLKVRRMPLEEVLSIIDDQLSTDWSVVYPLYTSGKSLITLKQALRGELEPPVAGWTNLSSRSAFGGRGFGGGGPGGGGFGGPGGRPGGGPGGPVGFGGVSESNLNQRNHRVSLEFVGKDVSFATMALARYAQARVVPEDGTSASVSLKLHKVTVADAVAKLARQARRSWTKLYVLRGGFGGRGRGGPGPGEMARAGTGDSNNDGGGRRGRDWSEMTPEQRDEMRQERETAAEELKQALPVGERQRLDQAQQQREQQFQEMQNLTPDQRRERFSQMGGASRDQRMVARVKNSTPDQRLERYRQMDQRRQRGDTRGRGR